MDSCPTAATTETPRPLQATRQHQRLCGLQQAARPVPACQALTCDAQQQRAKLGTALYARLVLNMCAALASLLASVQSRCVCGSSICGCVGGGCHPPPAPVPPLTYLLLSSTSMRAALSASCTPTLAEGSAAAHWLYTRVGMTHPWACCVSVLLSVHMCVRVCLTNLQGRLLEDAWGCCKQQPGCSWPGVPACPVCVLCVCFPRLPALPP